MIPVQLAQPPWNYTRPYEQEIQVNVLQQLLATTTHELHKNYTKKFKRLKVVYSSVQQTHLRAMERHLPYKITRCYLPHDKGERASS